MYETDRRGDVLMLYYTLFVSPCRESDQIYSHVYSDSSSSIVSVAVVLAMDSSTTQHAYVYENEVHLSPLSGQDSTLASLQLMRQSLTYLRPCGVLTRGVLARPLCRSRGTDKRMPGVPAGTPPLFQRQNSIETLLLVVVGMVAIPPVLAA